MAPDGDLFADLGYRAGAHDLARFHEDLTDELVRSRLDRLLALDHDALATTRSKLGEAELYLLLWFARRSCVLALRENRSDLALAAIDAISLVDRTKIDFRDLSVDFPLYTAKRVGLLPDRLDRSIARSPVSTAGAFAAKRDLMDDITLASCALIEVHSAYGTGFMDAWTGTYDPTTRIAEAGIELQDLVDQEGTYVTEAGHVSADVPEVWFSVKRKQAKIPSRATVSFGSSHVASTHSFSHGLLVFVAEVGDSTLADSLVRRAHEASALARPTVAVANGSRLALFIGGSVTSGEQPLETVDSLARFCDLAIRVL